MAVSDVYGFNDRLIEAVGLQKRKPIEIKEGDSIDEERLYLLKHKDVYSQKDPQFFHELLEAVSPDPALFQAKIPPSVCDWMSFHNEPGQTFSEFLRIQKNIPDYPRKKIYLLPIMFYEEPVPSEILKLLKRYATAFFGMPVKLLKKVTLKSEIPYRNNHYSGTLQVDAGVILKKLESRLPPDAFCLAGITMCDMYPRDSWNFVFGLANLIKRCGVYSLARYLSTFGEQKTTQVKVDREGLNQLLVRSCKVMCHEVCHMFGMKHCIYYECLMNGSNHLKEADERPLYLCPVCLRKLHLSCQFDIEERYRQLAEFTERFEMNKENEWFNKRLIQLSTDND